MNSPARPHEINDMNYRPLALVLAIFAVVSPASAGAETPKLKTPILTGPANREVQAVAQPQPKKEDEPAKPTSHTKRQLEGWTVRVDDQLLQAPNDALGTRALRFLENKLADIKAV